MNDPDFEFNMDFALMDQQIEKFKEEDSRLLRDWYRDCEQLHAQIADLHNINNELKEMFEQTVDKLTKTGITLADVGIQKIKLTIENEELKEKLHKYEKTH
jgi:hypothetical protein